MNFKSKMTSIAVASALTIGAFAMPTAASADVSSSATISSMYLWRGQDISAGVPALSGDIKYSHSSGAYAFGWMSSESASNVEVDAGLGYAGTAGPVAYDISYYKFWYPEKPAIGEKFADAGAEYVIGLTFDPITFKAFIDAKDKNDYNYYTLSGAFGKFGLLYGVSDSKTAGADYTHVDLSYAATDKLSFTVSQASGDGLTTANKDPLFMMSYSLPI
jgi:uncharacterized protein (TIGR02001 family)